MGECATLQSALLGWFKLHRRTLPWRTVRSPYRTWVSEVMLQQTQVATVIPYFDRWMKAYPNVAALAAARESDVLKLWEGLGYYSRARCLLRAARVITDEHAGKIPRDLPSLLQIPGVGRYTAGAIASIAHHQPAPVLDGNVMRVLCRVRDLPGDPRKPPLHEQLWALAAQLATHQDPASINESLMELGALVCTPKKPRCSTCPLAAQCRALKNGTVDMRPSPKAKRNLTARSVVIAVIRTANQVLLKSPDTQAEHWSGLHTLPQLELPPSGNPAQLSAQWLKSLGVEPNACTELAQGTFAITRFRFSYVALQALVPRPARKSTPGGYTWVATDELTSVALPAPHRRLARLLKNP